jgi:ABC-2 type transport system ATP-binding protein
VGQLVVEANDLTKNYGDFTAVKQLNLRIEEGEMFGFLGANGAGKTTTLLMLLGLTDPTSGQVRVCGKDPMRESLDVKRLVGYLPERVGFYEDLTAKQNLRYTAELNRVPEKEATAKIDSLLKTVGLSGVADKEVSTYSRGMKQRLGIADIWIKEPKLAFLDEPTTGIDPNGIDDILGLISDMGKKGITIIFCSHVLPHVQKLCSRVGILSKGVLVADGAIDRLGAEGAGSGRYRMEAEVEAAQPGIVEVIQGVEGVRDAVLNGNVISITADSDLRGQVSRAIIDSGALLVGMRVEEYNLEKIYKRYSKEA